LGKAIGDPSPISLTKSDRIRKGKTVSAKESDMVGRIGSKMPYRQPSNIHRGGAKIRNADNSGNSQTIEHEGFRFGSPLPLAPHKLPISKPSYFVGIPHPQKTNSVRITAYTDKFDDRTGEKPPKIVWPRKGV